MNMAHLTGIDKGPVLDWTDDNGLMEHYCRWRKKVEVLFKGPLTMPIIQLNATTSFIGLEKQVWN